MYATIWTSDEMVCFLGKTENIKAKLEMHRGVLLQPPIRNDPELQSAGAMHPQSVQVDGNSWKASSMDICIAGRASIQFRYHQGLASGLGWVAVGCDGEAEFSVWTLEGVRVTTRPALLRSYAKVFQKPGFSDTVKRRGVKKQ